jgi:hypothetical protein
MAIWALGYASRDGENGIEEAKTGLKICVVGEWPYQIVFAERDPTGTSDMQTLRDVFDANDDGKLDASDAEFLGEQGDCEE